MDVTTSSLIRLVLLDTDKMQRVLLAKRVSASKKQVVRMIREESNFPLQKRMLELTDDGLASTRGNPRNPEYLEPIGKRALHLHAVSFPPEPAQLPAKFVPVEGRAVVYLRSG